MTEDTTKGSMVLTANGFETTHYYKKNFVGSSSFDHTKHFGWTRNADGTVTISAEKVYMTEYGVARGYMESMTNCYASAKNFGLAACIEMFKTKVADFYDGVIPGTGSRGKKMEKDFDADLTTIRLVVGKSLLNEFKFNPKEVNKLCDFIDVAAAQVAERHKKDAIEVKKIWLERVAQFNAALPM